MKNKTITIMLGMILMISSVSALTIIAGNQEIVTLGVSPSYCRIVDSQNNSLSNYSLDGLNFTINGNEVIINTHPALKPDNYSLVCNYSWTEEDDSGSPKYGGSGICYRGYKTTEWSECIDNKQTRNVTRDRYGECYQTKQEEPTKEQSCEIEDDSELIIPPEEVEESNNKVKWIIIIASLIVLGLVIYALIRREDA